MIKLASFIESKIPINKEEFETIKSGVLELLKKLRLDKNFSTSSIRFNLYNYLWPVTLVVYLVKINETSSFSGDFNGSRLDPKITIELPKRLLSMSDEYVARRTLHILEHEYDHFIQFMLSWGKDNKYGLSKKSIHNKNYDYMGSERNTPFYRRSQAHDLQSIEFKPLVNTFSDRFKHYTPGVVDKYKRILFLFYIGQYSESSPEVDLIRKQFDRLIEIIQYDEYRARLLYIKAHDKPRWNLFVKEIYKEVF